MRLVAQLKYRMFGCLGIHREASRFALMICLLLWSLGAKASLIESTIGAAVVNDATATFYNPAALTLIKNPQIVTLASVSSFNSHFRGQAIQTVTGFTQFGSSSTNTHYFLPAAYFGIPINKNTTLGLGVIYNSFYRDIEDLSLLRYVQPSNQVRNIDFIPAIGFKINQYLALGAGITFTYVSFNLHPISGIPNLSIPDNQSRDQSNGKSFGGHIGFLLKPTKSTLIGFNYRSAITYQLSGSSTLPMNPQVTSNHYHFKIWTPARGMLSINQFVTSTLGVIGTIQYIQWSLFKDVNIHGLATTINGQPIILPKATAHYHLRNTWLLTLGSYYHMTPNWVARFAVSYNQSPSNPNYQIANGNSVLLAVSMGYKIYKQILIDAGYAHAFIRDQDINIVTNNNRINGVNQSGRNAFSLKLTFNII